VVEYTSGNLFNSDQSGVLPRQCIGAGCTASGTNGPGDEYITKKRGGKIGHLVWQAFSG